MYREIELLLYQAEAEYLNNQDLDLFQSHVQSLKQRSAVYQLLREHEIEIFQPVADQLLTAFPEEKQQKIEQALKHWLSVVRYCAMAMLLNNSSYLEHRLLEWLTGQVQAHQTQTLENKLFTLLQKSLQKKLSQEELFLLQPFLEQAKQTLLETNLSCEMLLENC